MDKAKDCGTRAPGLRRDARIVVPQSAAFR